MNLGEFVRQNEIKSADGEAFGHSPEFYQMREFEKTRQEIRGVLFLEPETYEVKACDVVLRGSVQERWDANEKKTKQRFLVHGMFRYPDMPEGLESIEDAVPAGETIDEAVKMLEAARQRFEFFQRYDLIDTGRYWLNRELKRCIVDDGKVIVTDD